MIACLFSCEYATCAVPEAFRELFKGSEELVTSAKGWDPGSLNLAQGFSMKFRTPLVHGDVTRLLIDLNQNGDERWSAISKTLPEATRLKLVDRHERPYRTALNARIAEDLLRNEAVLHVMVHTESGGQDCLVIETTQPDGIADDFASKWRGRLLADGVDVRIAREVVGGGLAASLIGAYPADRYLLLRLKVPQSYFLEGKPLRWATLKKVLIGSLSELVPKFEVPGTKE
jgi:hypothetical protein